MMVCYAVFKNADFNQILNILHARCTNVNTSLYFSAPLLVTVSKLIFHDMLACRWEIEFMTRHSMRMKWCEGTTEIRIEAGL